MLASEEDDIGPLLTGGDEFGQISDQIKKTADILARKRAKLLDALDEAKAASVAKSEFLSNMSHEIRTPLNGVVSGLSLLQSSSDEDEKQELTAAALNSAHALMNIINDVLDFSKLEAGRLEISPGPFLLARTLKDIRLLMRPLAAEKRTKLTLEMSAGCDVKVVADEVRLRQVITNLVGNAIKFTEDGIITIKAIMRGEEDKTLEVRVVDTGVGISKEEIGLLFRRFSQLSNSRAQKMRGTGLGLAICRQIVELMGGEIGVDSILGEGSTFWFRIPVGRASDEIPELAEEAKEEVGGGLNILLAEDVYINQMLITKMLTRLGHTVTLAENGQEAIDFLDEKPEGTFDLILLDNQMPILSGLEAAKLVRARGDAKGGTPIIALTADVLAEQREAFQNVGMNGFVSKPISIDKLRFEISRAIENKS
nr:ATP-binding protein [Kordiimonas marina]